MKVSHHVFSRIISFIAMALPFITTINGQTLSNDNFSLTVGKYGEVSSLRITGDRYPTNYVMNAANSPDQDTDDHQWVGELLFSYKTGYGDWMLNQSVTPELDARLTYAAKTANF